MSIDKVIEPFNPRRFIRRIGDWVAEGGNNTIIILGTDRAAPGISTVDSGHGDKPGTGCIHLIAGRHDQGGNPDMSTDDSFIYLARKTDVDTNLSTGMESQDDGIAAAIVKSDAVRLVARKSIKVVRDDRHYIYMDDQYSLLKIGGTTIKVDSGGVHVDSPGMKVDVNTSQAMVNASSATVNAITTINGLTTINGATTINGTLNVSGVTTVNAPVLATGVTAVGGGPMVCGTVAAATSVSIAGKEMSGHTHSLSGVASGNSSAVTGPPN